MDYKKWSGYPANPPGEPPLFNREASFISYLK